MAVGRRLSALWAVCALPGLAPAQPRPMTPADLFRVEQVGAVAWSPAGDLATVEIRRPGRWLDPAIPTNELRLLDARTGALTSVRVPGGAYVGFFGARWSPSGRRLLFLSVDTDAVVRPWLWDVTSRQPRLLGRLALRSGFTEPVVATWADDDHALVLARDSTAPNAGALYFHLTRGRNAADEWRRARTGTMPTATVMESGGSDTAAIAAAGASRIVAIDVRTGGRRTLARGGIHFLRLSPDRRTLAFFQERPATAAAPVAAFFAPAAAGRDPYGRVNWGSELHVVDPATGAPLATPADLVDPDYTSLVWLRNGRPAIRAGAAPHTSRADTSGAGTAEAHWVGLADGRLQPVALASSDTARGDAPRATPAIAAPRADAHLESMAPSRAAALYAADDPADGTRLWLARPGRPPVEVWRGNAWVRDVRTGRAEAIAYAGTDGTPLTGWLLLPPDYRPGTRLPIVTIVYPGLRYDAKAPPDAFSLLNETAQHPQLFAAHGYGVLLPSMPEAATPFHGDAIGALPVGVLPLLDTVVARGLADPTRIAVVGQSSGGFATLGLVTATNRFRTAVAIASYSDLLSLYGTFYGQYRYGDAGPPQVGQLFRMLQLERGYYGTGAPPWAAPDRYLANSPVLRAGAVHTPVMLVHGDLDFVPVQQAEEFFTALYRQDKRARFVRYQGEWHGIAARANVLDLWARMDDWLRTTMALP